MKKTLLNLKNFTLACGLVAAGLAATTVHADTTNIFSFQKGNLTKDGVFYGPGSGYSGVVDGALSDANATTLLTTTPTAGIGNFNRAGSPNGQQQNSFFAYDLTDLKNFITANTSISSTATVSSVSFSIIANAAASTGGGNYSWGLYGTDPFTSSCTWSNYDGVNPWTATPFQNLTSPNNTVQYGYTGGGSGNTTTYPLLNTNTVFLNGVAAGNPLTMSGGTNFISAVSNALARTDKTLYLTLRIPTFVNGDSRQTLIFSPTNTAASRPQIQITVTVIGTPPVSSNIKWVGNVSGTWDTSTLNWSDGANAVAYGNGKVVTFDDSLSTSPLTNNNITLSSTFSPSNCIASNSTYDYSLTGGGLAGNMNFTKQGGKTFSLGMSNSYSGLTTISAGTLLITHSNALGSVVSNTVVVSGASLALSNGITLSGEPLTLNGNGAGNLGALRSLDAVNPVTVACPITLGSDARIQTSVANAQVNLTGSITDSGSNYTLTLNAGQSGSSLRVNTTGITVSNVSLYTFTTTAGKIFFDVANAFPASTLLAGGGLFDLNGYAQTFNGLGQGVTPNAGVITNSSVTPVTLTIDYSRTTSASFASAISGNINVVKQGTGNQIFGGGVNAKHTYTGTTTVNGGILSLSSDMSAATGNIIVNSGATLRGAATSSGIGGSVIINSGGLYYPGSASNNIGNATILGNFTLNSGATMIATINPDLTVSNSSVNVSGTTTYGGTLVVYSIGHTNALQAGETFTIFPNGGTGNFSATNFNSIETQPGTTISFNGANGTVTVTATPAPSLSITPQGGGAMQINRSSSFYKLQYQTNTLDAGLSDSWVDYLPAMANLQTSLIVSNDPAIPSTFFRLAPKP